MAASDARRLVVNADDFGRSPDINEAVLRAHVEGILTTASLMVNEPAAPQAVELARACPHLGVGLHLTLLAGQSALPPDRIPGLVDSAGRFPDDPVRIGLRYFFRRDLRRQLEHEIAEQFEAFRATGLRLDHVNGHLNLQLHPTVFGLVLDGAARWGIRHFRVTRDPFWLNARLARGHWLYRISHAVIFGLLSWRARPALDRAGIRHTSHVFGLLQNGRVETAYLERLLPRLPPGDSELYSHPSRLEFRNELEALTSPSVRALVRRHGIELLRYQDL